MLTELGLHDLGWFVLSGLLLNITPGADSLFIAGHSAANGRRAGSMAALGIGGGCLVHVSASALGLSALLMASATLFSLVKWAGVAYLVYLGVQLWRSQPAAAAASASATVRARPAAIFWQGFLTNALNPKVALFFLAFLPQFVTTGSQHHAAAFLLLGLVFTFNGTLWNLLLAQGIATVARRLSDRAGAITRHGRRALGVLFVGLGVKLALADR